ncbi:nitroimidazol reductase NimA-like FMN-containing flavoprotein (pyridoxamine 5'-phosphate oxidase superfamily) [Streptomyces syringium]|uniref:Nitroimidazol reductase NimA-like FMN-containing flavoprotein (Pyridoxamine 5'-phosphate oxidase superfamily) n=1 Tax=Streptomyces syringium TaxID=76729 RepID=A0ABS4YD99_9ACTN|nr:nitroimidazol reductase NimA-like FMN-containing flavoprotein (pyridoxamine 5'-phosphate oxidase superfamily) [Streptomyces syringium]
MSKEQRQAFLSEGTRAGKLSTVRADGSPHIAPIWFLLDRDDLIFNTGENTVKGRNPARDGRVALCMELLVRVRVDKVVARAGVAE